MQKKSFSIKEALKFGQNITNKNMWFFIRLFIVALIISAIPEILSYFLSKVSSIFDIIINVGGFCLSLFISMGMIKIFLLACRGKEEELSISSLFSCGHYFIKYLLGNLLYMLITLCGFILLIIPGIIWSIQLQFFRVLIIDKNMRPIEALKKSSQLTKGVKWNLLLFSLAGLLVNLVGILCLGLGLFYSVPIVLCADIFIYQTLLAQTETMLQNNNDKQITTETQ